MELHTRLCIIQVHLQTQQEAQIGLWTMATRVVRTQGVAGLYNGLTASLVRQVKPHPPSLSGDGELSLSYYVYYVPSIMGVLWTKDGLGPVT